MRKKDLMRLLEERQERVELLMKRVESTENLLQTYQKREQSVVDAMAAARTAADQLIGEAAKRAEEMVRSAHAQAEALLEKAREESESLKKRTEISMAELAALPGVTLTASNARDFEIVPEGVDKGKALAELAAQYGITLEECAAVGDSDNDMAMLKAAGLPIAMGNASAAVKAAAKRVVASNAEDGVAQAILLCLNKN